MPVKHSTIPAGTDQPGFTGVTPSIWAQQHTFSGGSQGAVLVYNTNNSDSSAWIASAAGLFFSTGTNVLPSFASTINIPLTFSSNQTFSGVILAADGVIGTPSISFASTPTTGFYLTGGTLSVVTAGTDAYQFGGSTATGFTLNSAFPLSWGSSGTGTRDTFIFRDSANTIGQHNGANAQTLRVYNTFTDLSNYERGTVSWATNVFVVGSENAGTGSARSTRLKSASTILFAPSAGADVITISTAGLTFNSDNSIDIGASGATRPRNIFVGTNITAGGTLTWGGGSAISSSSNVALLNTADAFTGTGTYSFGPGGAGANTNVTINGSSASGVGPTLSFITGGVTRILMGVEAGIQGSGTSQNLAINTGSGLGINFYTNAGNQRWGINSAGDFTVGASSHIADSFGTPTIASGFGSGPAPTISGTDYAFLLTVGGGGGNGTVNFGHTWSTAPICTANWTSTTATTIVALTPTTGQVGITARNAAFGTGDTVYVLCRGY